MTDATYLDLTPLRKSAELPLPKPVPFAPPVFVNDVASPLSGETVLSLLLRRSLAGE